MSNKPYIAAELDKAYFKNDTIFTVGDGKQYGRSGTRTRRSISFKNVKLEPKTFYSVFQRTFKSTVRSKRFIYIMQILEDLLVSEMTEWQLIVA